MFKINRKTFGSTRGLSPCAIRISEKYLEILNKTIIFAAKKNNYMRIISKSTLVEYYTKEPKSKTALEEWYEKTKKSEWTCFADIKKTFNSVDAVGNQRYVFNIKGNDYRLIVLIQFTPKTIYIRFVGTHKEYDAIKNIQNI
jgi:mRNA interferase HigB